MAPALDCEKQQEYAVLPYMPALHEEQAFALWPKVFGEKWLIERSSFCSLFPPQHCFVAVTGDVLVGFVGTMPAANALTALFVRPDHQRQGIGMKLFHQAMAHLRDAGVKTATIGGLSMLWKGIPLEFASASKFFAKAGCTFTVEILDQYMDLEKFSYPPNLDQRTAQDGITLCIAEQTDSSQVIEFQNTFFPHWTEFFADTLAKNEPHKIGCVKKGRDILGTILIERLGSKGPGSQWTALSGKGFSSLATMGIDPKERGRGLGPALFAFASKCVKESGARVCFINYSEAAAIYRRCGYLDWSRYQGCEKAL